MEKYKVQIFYFIWDSKLVKIKRSVKMKNYKNGKGRWGLRFTNIDYFFEVLKAGLVGRIIDDQMATVNMFLLGALARWCKINASESTNV